MIVKATRHAHDTEQASASYFYSIMKIPFSLASIFASSNQFIKLRKTPKLKRPFLSLGKLATILKRETVMLKLLLLHFFYFLFIYISND